MAYSSEVFKHRDAYYNRIYYPTQKESKRWLSNTKYFQLLDKEKKLVSKRYQESYNGILTKRTLRLRRLQIEINMQDQMRLGVLSDEIGMLNRCKGF